MPRNRLNELKAEKIKINHNNDRFGLIEQEVTPFQVARIKKMAANGSLGQLYELYEKMEMDSRYGGVVNTLKSAITKVQGKWETAEAYSAGEKSIAKQYRDVVEFAMQNLDLHNLAREFAEAYLYGAKPYELVWDFASMRNRNDVKVLRKVKEIPVQSLVMDRRHGSETYGEMAVVTETNTQGIPISQLSPFGELKFFILEDGNGRRKYDAVGVARKCIDWYLLKIHAQQWWAEYTETYGEPIRIGRYPDGAGDEERNVMEEFLATLGRHAYGLFPESMKVQLIEANRQGTVTTYRDLIEYCNSEITIAVIGQLQTTDGGRNGSFAKAVVHDMVKYDILLHVAALVCKGFNLLARQIIRANFGDSYNRALVPTWKIPIPSPHNLTEKASVINTAKNSAPISLDHIWMDLGIPKPKEGQLVIFRDRVFEYSEQAFMQIMEEATAQREAAMNQQNKPAPEKEEDTKNEGVKEAT